MGAFYSTVTELLLCAYHRVLGYHSWIIIAMIKICIPHVRLITTDLSTWIYHKERESSLFGDYEYKLTQWHSISHINFL